VIVKGVQVEVELVGLDLLIPASECGLDLLRLAVVHARADVEGIVSDEHPYLGLLGSWVALRRLRLPEPGRRLGAAPRPLIEPAIHHDAALDSCRLDLWCGGMAVARSRVGGGGSLILEAADEDECERQW
jgi:hypothetical protein